VSGQRPAATHLETKTIVELLRSTISNNEGRTAVVVSDVLTLRCPYCVSNLSFRHTVADSDFDRHETQRGLIYAFPNLHHSPTTARPKLGLALEFRDEKYENTAQTLHSVCDELQLPLSALPY
jgi:hypothetical protein